MVDEKDFDVDLFADVAVHREILTTLFVFDWVVMGDVRNLGECGKDDGMKALAVEIAAMMAITWRLLLKHIIVKNVM